MTTETPVNINFDGPVHLVFSNGDEADVEVMQTLRNEAGDSVILVCENNTIYNWDNIRSLTRKVN